MHQIALNTELQRPAANVMMPSDVALDYESKLLNQAIEQSLHTQVTHSTHTLAHPATCIAFVMCIIHFCSLSRVLQILCK